MFGVHFSAAVPTNYRDWRKTDNVLYATFVWNLIEHGIMLESGSREPWLICEAHLDVDLQGLRRVATQAMNDALLAQQVAS